MANQYFLQRVKQAAASRKTGANNLCAKLKQMKGKISDPTKKNDPKSRINKSLSKHKCASDLQGLVPRLRELNKSKQSADTTPSDGFDPPDLNNIPRDVKLAAADRVLELLVQEIQESSQREEA